MKRSEFTEEQIAYALRQAEAGTAPDKPIQTIAPPWDAHLGRRGTLPASRDT